MKISEWELTKMHVDYLLASGMDWNELFRSKAARIKWLAYYVKNLPPEEREERIESIEQIKSASDIMEYLLTVKPCIKQTVKKGA